MKSETKLLEIRDHGTTIPALAVCFVHDNDEHDWLLDRVGYPFGDERVLLFHLARNVGTTNPEDWPAHCGRTMKAAHEALVAQWDTYPDGAVLDVRVPLGEASEPVKSDRPSPEVLESTCMNPFCWKPLGHVGPHDDIPF